MQTSTKKIIIGSALSIGSFIAAWFGGRTLGDGLAEKFL